MNNLEIAKAIQYLKPTAQFSFIGHDYSTIKWDFVEGNIPTFAELKNALVEIEEKEAAEASAKANAKALLLSRIGLSEDEAKLLLS